jgi:hypothetical protein
VDWHIVLIWGKALALIAKLARWKNNCCVEANVATVKCDHIIRVQQQPLRAHAKIFHPKTINSHPEFNLSLSFADYSTMKTY